MKSPERRARRLSSWYPRSWKATHGEEFNALLEDSIFERPIWPRRTLDVMAHGLRLRSAEVGRALHSSRRRAVIVTSASLVVALGAIAGLNGGFGLFGSQGPTKGGMPRELPGKTISYASIPDYLSVYIGPTEIGYTPKAYVTLANGSSGNSPMGLPAPVYASNLTTLLGHDYAGIGFVPLGTSPWSLPCRSGTGPSTLVLPNVVDMVTPTAVGKLSGLGIAVVIQNVRSRAITPGHIVSTSPPAGATIHACQPVTVDISVR